MDQDGDLFGSPSEMLISPRWGRLLSTLLLVNLSLVAWAAAFVPNQPVAKSIAAPAPRVPPALPSAGENQSTSNADSSAIPVLANSSEGSPETTEQAQPAPTEDGAPLAGEFDMQPEISAEWIDDPSPIAIEATDAGPAKVLPDVRVEAAPQEAKDIPGTEPADEIAPMLDGTQTVEIPLGLLIINPPTTGGDVHFLLAGDTITLRPGEYHHIATADERLVKFDRGADFGLVEQQVADEIWLFAVGSQGWHCESIDRAAASKLWRQCRQRPAEPIVDAEIDEEALRNDP
jgi:hypothetical protein